VDASEMLKRFAAHARSWGQRRSVTISYQARGNNTIRLGRDGSEILLYVKIRSEAPGFWGLTKNRLEEIGAKEDGWAVVVLFGSPDHGYLVPGLAVNRRIATGVWSLARDGDYKLNEGPGLDDSFRFEAIEECLERAIMLAG
jgi:hypothetical protein